MAPSSYQARIDLIVNNIARLSRLEDKLISISKTVQTINKQQFGAFVKDIKAVDRQVLNLGASFGRLGKIVRAGAYTAGFGALASTLNSVSAAAKNAPAFIGSVATALEQATGASAQLFNKLSALAVQFPETAAVVGVAGLAIGSFTPQLMSAAKASFRLGRAAAEIKTPLSNLIQTLTFKFGPTTKLFIDASSAVEVYRKRLAELSGTVKQLSTRQTKLQDTLDRFNSKSETAAKIAAKLVKVTRALNEERREQADLLRKAGGTTVTELEAAKGIKSIETKKRKTDFLRQQEQDILRVRQAIGELDQRGISALDEKLNIQRNITNLATVQAQQEKARIALTKTAGVGLSQRIPTPYRTAGSMGFPVALPEIAQDRKIKEAAAQKASVQAALNQQKTNSLLVKGVTTLRAQVAIAQQLDGVFDSIVASLTKANKRQGQLLRGRRNRETRQQLGGTNVELLKQIDRLTTGRIQKEQIKNKLFTAGAKLKNNEFEAVKDIQKEVRALITLEDKRIKRAQRLVNFRKKQRATAAKRKERLGEDLLLGAGFPLLTGQGPGGVIGGIAGAIFGKGKGGFGAQIAFSAIGAQFDKLAQNLTRTAASVGTTSDLLSVLDAAGVKVAGSLQLIIKELEETGQQTRAFALAQAELQKTYGTNGLTDLTNYDRANQRLADSFKRITSVVMPPLLRLATAISDITGGAINLFADGVERLVEAFRFLAGTPPGGGTGRARPDFRLEGGFAEASAFDRRLAQEAATRLPGEEERNQFKSSAFFKRYQKQLQLRKDERAVVKQINQLERQRSQEKSNALRKEIKLQNDQLQIVVDRATQNVKNIQERNRLLRMAADLERQILTYREDASAADLSARQKILNVNASLVEQGQKGFIPVEQFKELQKNVDSASIFNQVSALSAILGKATKTYTVKDILILTEYYRIALTEEQNLQKETKKREKLLKDIEKVRETTATIDRFIQPLLRLRQEHERSLETQKEYNRLLMEGMLPAEAKRISEFNEQVRIQLQQIDNAILLAEAEAVRLSTNELLTKEYEEQLKKINDLKKARGAVVAEGAKGPGGKEQSSKDIIQGRIAELRGELTEMTKLGNVVVKVADSIGSAFSTAFQDVINGSKSTQEALSDMLKSVGEDFVAMAAEIIVKQLTMIALQALLKALGGPSFSGGESAPAPSAPLPKNGSAFQGIGSDLGGGVLNDPKGLFTPPTLMAARASGGPVNRNGTYMVGENGPELFRPTQAGRIDSNSDLRSAMSRQRSSAPAMNFSFETTNIGGTEYVSREQLEAAMAVTRKQAASDGAKRGMNMTLDKMQHSPATRRRVGI